MVRIPGLILPATSEHRVNRHSPTFFAQLDEQGESLPAFVHQKFERLLRCGRLEEGLARVGCTGCRHST
jgi:hypothetical protein